MTQYLLLYQAHLMYLELYYLISLEEHCLGV